MHHELKQRAIKMRQEHEMSYSAIRKELGVAKSTLHGWLVAFCGVSKESLRAELHLYPTMDIPKEIQFWKDELGFADHQFYKTQIRQLQKSSFSYPESFRHGTCSLNFSSVERKTELMAAIKALLHSQPAM
jgi:hypothetical protein